MTFVAITIFWDITELLLSMLILYIVSQVIVTHNSEGQKSENLPSTESNTQESDNASDNFTPQAQRLFKQMKEGK